MPKKEFDYFTISHAKHGEGFDVHGWGTYARSSVLAGQPRKAWIESYETLEAAQAAYPGASMSSKWIEPQVSLSHLPDPDLPDPMGDDEEASEGY
jgi:hypothetical protein